jgi:signal transduction histidine kinase
MITTATPVPAPRAHELRGHWVRRVIRTPLLQKLVVVDLVINVAAFWLLQQLPPEDAQEVTLVSLIVVLVLNTAIVYWALRPLQALEETAHRVSHGDFDARVRIPALGDRNIARISATFNELLDRVSRDRDRLRALAGQVITAGDRERAHIARELHDSTAQSLSALDMLVASSLQDPTSAEHHEKLSVMRDIVASALGEVRNLSHFVHPRVLDDLGLEAAVEFLARLTREQSGIAVRVASNVSRPVPAAVASVLYRVAQEAVRNAVKHAAPRQVRLELVADGAHVRLTVADDGGGFDREVVEQQRRGLGLFVMEERLSLVGGRLGVDTAPGRGTVVRADVDLHPGTAAA